MSDFLNEKETVETNANSQGVIDEVERQKQIKKKTWKISLIVGAVLVVFIIVATLIGILEIYSESENNDDTSDTYYEEQTEEETVVDNSVNGKGYYYFDNGLDDTISNYKDIVDQTDESTFENSIDDITVDKFTKSKALFLDTETVTEYFYQYFNGHTGVSLFVNEDGSIPAFTYLYTSAVTNGSNYTQEAQVNQLIYKPAKWLYALSDDLTYDEALDIYKILFTQHLDAISQAKAGGSMEISHYYKGYTITVSGNESTEAITVIKSDSDFASKNSIYAGGNSIMQPVSTSDSNGNITVYFENSQSWGDINYYIWSDVETMEWPGKQCTYLYDNIWSATIPSDSQYIIFNDGENQTADIILEGGNKIAKLDGGYDINVWDQAWPTAKWYDFEIEQ